MNGLGRVGIDRIDDFYDWDIVWMIEYLRIFLFEDLAKGSTHDC